MLFFCLLFGIAAQGEFILEANAKTSYCLIQEHLGYLYITDRRDVCVSTRSVTGSNNWAPKHAVYACSAAYYESCHWFWDHTNSQASHSVMEISHLIETFLCGSNTDTSYTQFEPFDVLNIADGFGSLSLGRFPFLTAEGKDCKSSLNQTLCNV